METSTALAKPAFFGNRAGRKSRGQYYCQRSTNPGISGQAIFLDPVFTAGQDSSTLLALARPLADKASFFTFAGPAMSADKQMARVLAKKFNLSHAFYNIQTSSEHDLKSRHDMTGACVGGDIARIYTTLKKMRADSALLPGMCGEVARAYYWREGDEEKSPSVEVLLKRAGLPLTKVCRQAMQDWLDGLAD